MYSAIGHSARDTFQVLNDKQVPMEAKAFAVGIRMEHPQEMIDLAQYGQKGKIICRQLIANLPHS